MRSLCVLGHDVGQAARLRDRIQALPQNVGRVQHPAPKGLIVSFSQDSGRVQREVLPAEADSADYNVAGD
jgi:hypothetical protein